MDIFFVVDSLKDLDKKIDMITSNFGTSIKFFVNTKLAVEAVKNKLVLNNMQSLYKGNVKGCINEFIKKEEYTPNNTLLYFSSVDIDRNVIDGIKASLINNPICIYVKGRLGWFGRLKQWVYQHVTRWIFGVADECACDKMQYLSATAMQALKDSSFCNHIFKMINTLTVETENNKTLYDKIGFKKYNLVSLILLFSWMLVYVLCETFFKIRFWMYLLLIIMLLIIAINQITMWSKTLFDKRYKK